jgi:RNA polymerase sigma factor (sigma-70 family)
MSNDQERRIAEVIEQQRSRLRNFIRKRVSDERDAEDILQDAFYEFVEAFRLLKRIERIGPWLFQVARNRIIDLYRRKKPEISTNQLMEASDEGGLIELQDLLPSPDAGPEALYARGVLLDELDAALHELPEEQSQVFIAHQIHGRSFKDISADTGIGVNTLILRKHYAVLHLRRRLQSIYREFKKG